jgi:hypothetical protein
MRNVAIYRCLKCGTEYRPLDAGACRFMCCGIALERVERGTRGFAFILKPSAPVPKFSAPTPNSTTPPQRFSAPIGTGTLSSATLHPFTEPTEVLEIIPPRENTVDALAVELLLSRFAAETPFSLEIAGDAHVRRFLFRAPRETLAHLRRQIQATYPQAEFRAVPPEEDPAYEHKLARMSAEFSLRRPLYLPLRTFRNGDFLEADPVLGLLGTFADLEQGERMLSQLILFPAPPDWADRYQGMERQVERGTGEGGPRSMNLFLRQFAGFVGSCFLLAAVSCAIITGLQHRWFEFAVAIATGVAALGGVLYAVKSIGDVTNVNPEMVKRKLEGSSAYDVSLRLTAFAQTPELARLRLRSLVKAYAQFNLASGNALEPHIAEFDPRDIALPRWSLWQEWLGRGMRLTVAEIASMWHLPVGFETPFVERAKAKRLLPLPNTVEQGILIGHSVHQGQRIPVHLDAETLWHHNFMVAKTQKGKSTLMANLAVEAMKKDAAVVVIDPHGDLARAVLGIVPTSRAKDVVYVDLSDSSQIVGLNLLDMTQGRSADRVVSHLVHVGEMIWSDYWGPRMEDALRMAARTLLYINERFAARGQQQFTLLDILPLFELGNFRHRLLKDYVKDADILEWWSGYFERMYQNQQIDVINPVQTKIHRFSTHATIRGVVAQSRSTINFRELLAERRILLVNTATGVIGPDAGGILGAVIVDYINFAVREQMAIPDPSARAKVIVVIDEFQSIPGVDYKGLLAELQKMGASFILATQALGQLDAINKELRASILSNIASLFVFQTSAEDADLLRHELDEAVTATDIINLDDYACYVKTQLRHTRLPVMHVETLPPPQQNRAVIAQITGQMGRYTRAMSVVASERDGFQEQWYGRERAMLKKLMLENKLPGSTRDRSGERGKTDTPKPTPSSQTPPGAGSGVRGSESSASGHTPPEAELISDIAEPAGSGQVTSGADLVIGGTEPADSEQVMPGADLVIGDNETAESAQIPLNSHLGVTEDQAERDRRARNEEGDEEAIANP